MKDRQLRLFKLPDWDTIQAGVNLKGGGGGVDECPLNRPAKCGAMGNGIYYVVLCLSGQAFSSGE